MDINTISLYTKAFSEVEYEMGESKIRIKTPDHEEGFGLIIKNSGSASENIILKGGNSIMSVGDTVITVNEGETLISLKDTGRYKNVSGEDAGYIVLEISNPGNISLFAFSL